MIPLANVSLFITLYNWNNKWQLCFVGKMEHFICLWYEHRIEPDKIGVFWISSNKKRFFE